MGFNRNNIFLVKHNDWSTFNKCNQAAKPESEETFLTPNINRKHKLALSAI